MNKINMTQIAQRAGISQKTVSRVLNNEKYVKKETREKVMKLVKELNYQPNHFAASLKKGKTNLIGISVSGRGSLYFSNPYLNLIYQGSGKVLTGSNYKMVFHLLNVNLQNMDQAHELVESRTIDGMIYVLGSEFYDTFKKVTLPYFKKLGSPFVVIHSLAEPLDCPNIGLDSVKAGYMATKHLIDLGYRTIGCVGRPERYLHAGAMYRGYRKAMEEHGVNVDDRFIYELQPQTREDAHAAATELVREKRPLPEALFFTMDDLAEGMIKGFKDAGVRVPEDLAAVGFSNTVDTFYLPLTTIHQPAVEKGRLAAEYLLKAIDEPDKADKKWFHLFEPELVVRETCGTHLRRGT